MIIFWPEIQQISISQTANNIYHNFQTHTRMLIVSTTRTILIPRAVRMSMAPLARAAVGSAKRGYADGDTGSYTRHDGSSDSFNVSVHWHLAISCLLFLSFDGLFLCFMSFLVEIPSTFF